MNATSNEPGATREFNDPPEFGLHCRFDDPEDPSEVTVFPADAGENMTEQWLSIDNGHVLPIEEVR